jgi:hypothetical protein
VDLGRSKGGKGSVAVADADGTTDGGVGDGQDTRQHFGWDGQDTALRLERGIEPEASGVWKDSVLLAEKRRPRRKEGEEEGKGEVPPLWGWGRRPQHDWLHDWQHDWLPESTKNEPAMSASHTVGGGELAGCVGSGGGG